MRVQATTWAIASGEPGSGKTTVAGCLAALLQNQGARTVVLNADLKRENYLLSAPVNSGPDALFASVLSQGYLSVVRQRLGDDFDRTLTGLRPAVRQTMTPILQLFVDFGSGSSDKYAEFFPLVTRPVVVATPSGESVALALSFVYRALLRCLGRRLQDYPEATGLVRRALRHESAGKVTRLSEIAYNLIGLNRHAAEVARGLIRGYHPLLVLNRCDSRISEDRLRALLAEVRMETDLDVTLAGTLPNEPRLTDMSMQVSKLSLDDPESDYAIWLAREFARKLQGASPRNPASSGPSTRPQAQRLNRWGDWFGSLAMRLTIGTQRLTRQAGSAGSGVREGAGGRSPRHWLFGSRWGLRPECRAIS